MPFSLVRHGPALLRAQGYGGGDATAYLSCSQGPQQFAVLISYPPTHDHHLVRSLSACAGAATGLVIFKLKDKQYDLSMTLNSALVGTTSLHPDEIPSAHMLNLAVFTATHSRYLACCFHLDPVHPFQNVFMSQVPYRATGLHFRLFPFLSCVSMTDAIDSRCSQIVCKLHPN